jgi:hypothetical protein
MSATNALDIADAMVAAINAETFNPAIVAGRAYVVAMDLRTLKTIQVNVVPKSVETTRAGRGFQTASIEIDLAVQRVSATLEECDAMMAITDQIVALFEFQDLGNLAKNTKTERKFIYDSEGLETKKLFTSLTTFTFELNSD